MMAERKFGADTFRVDPLPVTKALVLQGKIAKALGPAIAKLPIILSGLGEKATSEAKAASDGAMVAALGDILGKLEPEDAAGLIREIVEIAQVRRPSGYDQVLIDEDLTLGDVVPFVGWVLQEQFRDFFLGLLADGRRAAKSVAH